MTMPETDQVRRVRIPRWLPTGPSRLWRRSDFVGFTGADGNRTHHPGTHKDWFPLAVQCPGEDRSLGLRPSADDRFEVV
jgi:hypothetical protein